MASKMSQQNSSIDTPTARKGKGHVNRGVAIPLSLTTNKSKETSRDGSRKPVDWQGPKPESSTGGEPFSQTRDSVVNVPPVAASTQLQPKAASFQPSNARVTPSSGKPSPISMLLRGSVADDGRPTIVQSSTTKRDASGGVRSLVIRTRDRAVSPKSRVQFTTDLDVSPFLGGHYIKISRVSPADYDESMTTLQLQYGWQANVFAAKAAGPDPTTPFMTIFFCFDDYRDAEEAVHDVAIVNSKWEPVYVNHADYAGVAVNSSTRQAEPSYFDGQVVFVAHLDGNSSGVKTDNISLKVLELAKEHGDVSAFADIEQSSSTTREFRVEYYRISDAREVLSLITDVQPYKLGDYSVMTKRLQTPSNHMITPQKSRITDRDVVNSATGRTSWSYLDNGEPVIEQPSKMLPDTGVTPTHGNFLTPERQLRASAPAPYTPATFGSYSQQPRSGSWPSANRVVHLDTEPQCVSIHRISIGQDVRTTIMMRNLPNRWTWMDFKRALDEVSGGKYDFSYLRIDFVYNTNVGYGFVNFIDPLDIIKFVERWVGKEWAPGTFPRKTAQVSYATVQGYDCLVEKFRNSAIMDEYPGFRPKLWYTLENAPEENMIGTEKDFPLPNNLSKKQRSHDNAGSVGLFTTSSGRRGGQRPHHSNWDRGTTRQLQEDAAWYGQFPPASPAYFGNGHYTVDGGQASIGSGFPAVPPYYSGFAGYQPVMPYADGYAAPYGVPFFPPVGFPWAGSGYQNGYNPGARLRTMTKGRLSTRPRNTVVGDTTSHYFTDPDALQQFPYANVPRTLGANGNGNFSNDARNHANSNGNSSYSQQYNAQY